MLKSFARTLHAVLLPLLRVVRCCSCVFPLQWRRVAAHTVTPSHSSSAVRASRTGNEWFRHTKACLHTLTHHPNAQRGREGVEEEWEKTAAFHERWKLKARDVLAKAEWRKRKLTKRVGGGEGGGLRGRGHVLWSWADELDQHSFADLVCMFTHVLALHASLLTRRDLLIHPRS